MNKKTIVFGMICFLALIIIIIVLLLSQNKKTTITLPLAGATPTPVSFPSSERTIPSPIFQYRESGAQKMITAIRNRQPLIEQDQQAKAKIIAGLSTTSETVYTSDEFGIDYIRTPDMFQVEIRTDNIQKAKTDAVLWFQSQGISKDAICKIPVTFYLNFSIIKKLYNTNIQFNPLAEGC